MQMVTPMTYEPVANAEVEASEENGQARYISTGIMRTHISRTITINHSV